MVINIDNRICFFLKCPTSCARTETNSSSECFFINVSYSAIVFLGPNPLKKALALDDLFEPSITKIFFKEYPTLF